MIDHNKLRTLFETARYIALATVNENGSPHNSPVFFIPDTKLERIYMGTHPDSLHARNIRRTGQAYGVVYDKIDNRGVGLYLKIENFHECSDEELPHALGVHNQARAKFGKQPLVKELYGGESPQRMYEGSIVEVSTNDMERNADGHIIKDSRVVIQPTDVISAR